MGNLAWGAARFYSMTICVEVKNSLIDVGINACYDKLTYGVLKVCILPPIASISDIKTALAGAGYWS